MTAKDRLLEQFPDTEGEIEKAIDDLVKADMRRMVLEEGRRIDGRGFHDLRPISCEVGLLPRVHGSALFTRGQTQCLAVTTLGTKMDERLVDDLSLPEGKAFKSYMLDYNMPPFSGGEVKPVRGPNRREIGHGALAEKAIEPVIPSDEVFPYTIRVVSDILESNSSTSMATVCASSLSLMDAGVPIKCPVAGIGIGLVKEADRVAILTDILGAEDHLGDMDLKVAGSREGITAIQMDIKIGGITFDIMREAFEQAREGRLSVLDIMEGVLPAPRAELSRYAPRIIFLKIDPSQIGTVIGPGGKQIREIEETGAKVNIEDDGTVTIASVDSVAGEAALMMIKRLVQEPEIGEIYDGTVKKIATFGAFVEILPGKEGLVHISELEPRRVEKVEDVLRVGDRAQVKVIGIDEQGKIKLSRKAVLGPSTEHRHEKPMRPRHR
jgi:polyribonucleotide nucleotidyltransferase